ELLREKIPVMRGTLPLDQGGRPLAPVRAEFRGGRTPLDRLVRWSTIVERARAPARWQSSSYFWISDKGGRGGVEKPGIGRGRGEERGRDGAGRDGGGTPVGAAA